MTSPPTLPQVVLDLLECHRQQPLWEVPDEEWGAQLVLFVLQRLVPQADSALAEARYAYYGTARQPGGTIAAYAITLDNVLLDPHGNIGQVEIERGAIAASRAKGVLLPQGDLEMKWRLPRYKTLDGYVQVNRRYPTPAHMQERVGEILSCFHAWQLAQTTPQVQRAPTSLRL